MHGGVRCFQWKISNFSTRSRARRRISRVNNEHSPPCESIAGSAQGGGGAFPPEGVVVVNAVCRWALAMVVGWFCISGPAASAVEAGAQEPRSPDSLRRAVRDF